MGEARRKKLAGLMPLAEERVVVLHRGGQVEGGGLPQEVVERFREWAGTGQRWDARYRTAFIGAGVPQERLTTRDELLAIPLPQRLRLRLHLLSGPDAWKARELEVSPESFIGEGDGQRQLSLRATEYELNGHWVALPEFEPEATLRYLMQHPAVTEAPQGEPFTATFWRGGERDGQLELDPAPGAAPADPAHAAALQEAARSLLDLDDDEWLQDHIEQLGDRWMSDEVEGGAPLARRVRLLLAPAPLVLSPTVLTLVSSGELDVLSSGPAGSAYTLDGETWHPYPNRGERRDTLRALLAEQGGELDELLGTLQQDPQEQLPRDPQEQTPE